MKKYNFGNLAILIRMVYLPVIVNLIFSTRIQKKMKILSLSLKEILIEIRNFFSKEIVSRIVLFTSMLSIFILF